VRVPRGMDLRAVRWATVRATARATPLLILASVDSHADQQWPGADRQRRRHRSARARLADWLLRLAGRGAGKWVCRLMTGLAGSVADGRDRLTERLPPLSSAAPQQNLREFSRVPLGSRGGLAHRTYVRETRRAREGSAPGLRVASPAVDHQAPARRCVVVAAATGEKSRVDRWAAGLLLHTCWSGGAVTIHGRGEGPAATSGPGLCCLVEESRGVPLVSACFLAHRTCVRTLSCTRACASWVNHHRRAGNLPALRAGRGSSW
jgi:hypothetical protein